MEKQPLFGRGDGHLSGHGRGDIFHKGYSQAVRAGNRLFILRAARPRPGKKSLEAGDVEAHADTALANLDLVLRRFQAQRTDIAKTNSS